MKLIQNEAAKQEVLAAFRRVRFHPKPAVRKDLVKVARGEAILGTGYGIAFMGPGPVRYYGFNGVLCHEEYGPLDGDTLAWMQAEGVNPSEMVAEE